MAAEHPMDNIKPGIKVAAQMSPEPSEEDLQFARQMGVEYVVLWTDGAHANYDYFMSRREIFENAGLKIYGFGNGDVHCQAALVLNLPNRDEKVEQYKRYISDLGRAGNSLHHIRPHGEWRLEHRSRADPRRRSGAGF